MRNITLCLRSGHGNDSKLLICYSVWPGVATLCHFQAAKRMPRVSPGIWAWKEDSLRTSVEPRGPCMARVVEDRGAECMPGQWWRHGNSQNSLLAMCVVPGNHFRRHTSSRAVGPHAVLVPIRRLKGPRQAAESLLLQCLPLNPTYKHIHMILPTHVPT